MNFIKALNTLILITLLCGIFLKFHLTAMTENYDFDELSLEEIEEYETKEEPLRGITPPIPLKEILRLALSAIDEPIWKSTKPPKGRNILYLIPHKITAIEYGGLDLNLFFNMTNKMNATFDSLIKLDKNLEEIIRYILGKISDKAASSLIPLLKKATIQERKVGGLLQAGFIYKYFNIQLHTSLQLSERNFWLTKKDQDKIKELFEKTESTVGGGNESSTSSFEFKTSELYKIKYGLGDTRVKVGLNALNTSNIQLDIGFEGIIPTAEKIEIDNLETYKNLPQDYPTDVNKENEELTNWIISNLKNIRDNLLNPQFGNNGHWGIGFFIESKISLFHNAFDLWNRFSINTLLENSENRLILLKQKTPNFEIGELTTSVEKVVNLLMEKVFPQPFKTTIKPGSIFNLVSSINMNISRRWIWGVGYDLFLQQKEIIKKIYDKDVDPHDLRIEDAQIKQATQHKVFTETNYLIKNKDWNLIVGIGADTTFSSQNIGHDWTVYLRIGASF